MSEVSVTIRAGRILKRLIEENDMTQEEFAFDFGADVRTINRYVNSGINQLSTLQELARYFNVDIKYFFPDN